MRFILKLAAVLLMTVPMAAAELIIPVSGVTAGANGSFWQSDLTIHNAGSSSAAVTLTFHDEVGPRRASELTIAPRQTLLLTNVVGDELGIVTGLGAIVLETDELTARKLSVSSRIYTNGPAGELGQDVAVYTTADLATDGETAVITGPVDVDSSRFNFGIYAHAESEVEFVLFRADGEEAGTAIETYDAGTQLQYNAGVSSLFGVAAENGDTIYARVLEGAVALYGSIVANSSNDPSFVPQTVTVENFATVLLGVDIDEDGTIDIADANGDGVLDAPIRIPYSGFPVTLNVIVVDPEGEIVTLELLTEAGDIKLYGDNTLQIYPYLSRRGTTEMVLIRATDGFRTADYVLPVEFL